MGGQQFAEGGVLLDTQCYGGVRSFDRERGLVEVESGIQWPELIAWLVENQAGSEHQWGIRQKQTGADRLSVGGAVAANVHGRGLTMRPFIADVEDLTIIGADGERRRASRTENAELFRLDVWRVRALRLRGHRHAAPRAAPQGASRGGDRDRRSADRPVRRAHRGWIRVWRLPVRARPDVSRFPAPGHLLVLQTRADRHADPGQPAGALA